MVGGEQNSKDDMMPFTIPTLTDMLRLCEQQDLAIGILLLGVGLVFVVMGVKIFKALIPISFAAIGFVLGVNVPVPSDVLRWSCGGLGAVILGLGSSYICKAAVAVLAGGWTALFATSIAISFNLQQTISLGIGVVFFLAVASLTVALYNQVIAYVTSLEGAMLTVGGLVATLHHTAVWSSLRTIVIENSFVAPFFVVALTIMGFYLQLAETRQLESGMSG